MRSSEDIIVIGGGIIGLSIAFELASRGATVRVLERGEAARSASWAAAGMLAPHTEHIEDELLRTLCIDSFAAYPTFVQRVMEASGIDPFLQLDGILTLAYDEPTRERLAQRAEELARTGVAARFLDRAETLAAEPSLSPHVLGGLLFEDEGHVDNRRLGRALLAASRSVGVGIEEQVRDCVLECDARRVLGVRTPHGFTSAQAVVNACGAWADALLGIEPRYAPKVTPIKGQMLALQISPGLVHRVLWVPGAYLVPRADGRLLIGATVENVGFDERVTAQGIRGLLAAALEAVPALRDCTMTETWAGLRPFVADERPVIGASELSGYYRACGHYRNGILLAPITARRIADAIESAEGACAV